MNNTKNTDKYTFPEISVEDFDNMGNLEDHVFSEKYNQRKEKEIIAMMKKNRLFGNRFAKVAAAAFLVLATPAAVYAIANNQIANGFWGNDTLFITILDLKKRVTMHCSIALSSKSNVAFMF